MDTPFFEISPDRMVRRKAVNDGPDWPTGLDPMVLATMDASAAVINPRAMPRLILLTPEPTSKAVSIGRRESR